MAIFIEKIPTELRKEMEFRTLKRAQSESLPCKGEDYYILREFYFPKMNQKFPTPSRKSSRSVTKKVKKKDLKV